MPELPLLVDGDDGFLLGMDSYTQPSKLNPGEYANGMNLVNRGGIVQTRPGSRSLPFEIPGTNLQGLKFFKPSTGIPQLVFAVDGLVYFSPFPFVSYSQLQNIRFSPYTKFIAWASCVKSTYYDTDGVLKFLDNPISVLVMQDGSTRAAYWDGSVNGHLNPTHSTGDITVDGFDETPVGLWMTWANNRLWVSRGSQVFASDIGNPLKFTEDQYLNEGRAFYLPADCTGVVETSDRQGIVCFTATTGTFLQSSIQDRTLWLTTPGFQQTILPTIGCVAPRSIVQQYGLIYWWTQRGLVSQNNALQLNITSRMDTADNEMVQSKANLSYDLSAVCGGSTDNFLFHGVPNGDKLNTRVHVLDQCPFETVQNAWPSYWMGWRPVEFACGTIESQDKVYCLSYDYDGKNRIWELFRSEKTDNGIPITCFVITKQHFFGNRDYKNFRYAELELSNLQGDVAVLAAAAGLRGAFQPVLSKDISSTVGQVYYNDLYGQDAYVISGSKPQTRVSKSSDGFSTTACNNACVETDLSGLVDKCFCLMIMWSGIAGVSAYRIFAQSNPQALEGTCEENETGETRILTQDGCAATDRFSLKTPLTRYFATASFTKNNPETCQPVTGTSTQDSFISQQDADRKAERTAEWIVMSQIGEI